MNVAVTAPKAAAEPRAPTDRLPRSRSKNRQLAHRAAGLGRLAAAALLIGVLLRLAQFAVNRSLWMDEALLVSNFLDGPWSRLLETFERGQTAPLGFLALVKGAAALLGRAELALRLVPLLAGLATLALLPRVARRYTTRPALPFAVALVALAPYLVYYSSEVKPYAFDALASVVVLALAHDLARRPRDRRLAVAFALAGAVAVWFSQPAAFMLAGTGTVLGVRALRRRDFAAVRLLVPVALAWAVSFAGSYAVARHQLGDAAYMKAFWRTGFAPLPPRGADEWLWLPRMLARVFREPMGVVGRDTSALSTIATAAAIVLFVAGAAWMARHRSLRLALLLAPAGVALLASAAHVYPFGAELSTGGRVLVFLLPSIALVMAEGVAAVPRALPIRARRAAIVVSAALALLPAAAYAALSVPQLRAEVKPLLEYVNEQRRPGDLMYVYYNGQPVFEYYAPRYGWSRSNTVAGACARMNPGAYVDDLARLRGRPRVWLLFVEGTPVQGFDEQPFMLSYLDHVGRRLDDRVSVGAAVYLYDLRETDTRPEPFRAALPRLRPDPAQECRGAWQPLNQLR